MNTRIALALSQILLCALICSAQQRSSEKKYFPDGRLKSELIHFGGDTVQYLSYHSNGLMRDSAWLLARGRREIPLGTAKQWHHEGQLRSISHAYDSTYSNIFYWRRNGVPFAFYESPGVQRRYNKKGNVFRETDENKDKVIAIPSEFRKRKHLANSPLGKKIVQTHGYLVKNSKKIRLVPNVFMSVRTTKDTMLLKHCNIEGFFSDSVVLSKFDYDRTNSGTTMRYDSTFVLKLTDISELYYSRRNTRARYFTAITFSAIGLDCMVIPFGVGLIIEGVSMLAIPGAWIMTASGLPVYLFGRWLFKTMVPKKYDLKDWKIQLNK